MLVARPGTFEALREVCQKHLSKPLPAPISLTLHPDWFLDLHFSHVVEKEEQRQHLDQIEKSLRTALRAIDHLHLDVRRSIEHQASANLRIDEPVHRLVTFVEIDGQSRPIETFDNIRSFISASLGAFLGIPADTPHLSSALEVKACSAKSAGIEALKDENMRSISSQEAAHETWQKALTVKRCRHLWSVGNDAQAPISYTATSNFGLFLGDVISALDKFEAWPDPRSVMRAWRERAESDPWFL